MRRISGVEICYHELHLVNVKTPLPSLILLMQTHKRRKKGDAGRPAAS